MDLFSRTWFAGGVVLVASLLTVPTAEATFPGTNGKLAYRGFNVFSVHTVNSDGSGNVTLAGPCREEDPVWSPDGTRIAFAREYPSPSCNGDWDIAIMNADGTGVTLVSGAASGADDEVNPAWSPDGSELAFSKGEPGLSSIYGISAAGGSPTQLSNPTDPSSDDEEPDWSPDGTKIVFHRWDPVSGDWDLYWMNRDGTGEGALIATTAQERSPSWNPSGASIAYERGNSEIWVANVPGGGTGTNVSNSAGIAEQHPVWSPDGKQIAFDTNCCDLQRFNADGSGRTTVTNDAWSPDWQRLTGYVRPVGASPTRLALVPAYKGCTSPNGVHETPSIGSCVPPVQSSDHLTIGTPDANGQGAKSLGSARFSSILGNPSTPADEADLGITLSISDVRNKSNLTDYAGQLELRFDLERTDKRNRLTGSSGYVLGGTTTTSPYSVTVGCNPTPADSTVGSTCSIATTADALATNTIAEGKRTIWQAENVEVVDGGADGNPNTSGNTLFAEAGNFIP